MAFRGSIAIEADGYRAFQAIEEDVLRWSSLADYLGPLEEVQAELGKAADEVYRDALAGFFERGSMDKTRTFAENIPWFRQLIPEDQESAIADSDTASFMLDHLRKLRAGYEIKDLLFKRARLTVDKPGVTSVRINASGEIMSWPKQVKPGTVVKGIVKSISTLPTRGGAISLIRNPVDRRYLGLVDEGGDHRVELDFFHPRW
ncbi:MAG TPA: hypothetical protein VIH90_03285 [Candidatus Saccharimonadales bacterium]